MSDSVSVLLKASSDACDTYSMFVQEPSRTYGRIRLRFSVRARQASARVLFQRVSPDGQQQILAFVHMQSSQHGCFFFFSLFFCWGGGVQMYHMKDDAVRPCRTSSNPLWEAQLKNDKWQREEKKSIKFALPGWDHYFIGNNLNDSIIKSILFRIRPERVQREKMDVCR